MRELPASLRRRDDVEAIRDDLLPYRGTSIDERARIMSELCRFAAEATAAHPKRDAILRFQEPRSPESMALWLRLVAAARRTR